MNILVTGATGQVGSAIAAHLAALGHTVTGLSRRHRPVAGMSRHVGISLGSPDFVARVSRDLERQDAIVHAAACLSENAPELALVNCTGTRQVADLAREWKCAVVYISGLPVIGRPAQLPVTETHPAAPRSAYHTSKLFGEFMMQQLERDGIAASSLRVTSPAGAGTPKTRLLGVFVARAMQDLPLQLLGTGSRRQNFVDVRDVAAGVERALITGACGLFNIAGGESIGNHSLAELCVAELRSSSPIEFSPRPDPEEGVAWDVSIAKAERELGYRPAFGIRDSIQAVAHEYSRTDPE